MPFYGKKPVGAAFYAQQKNMEMIAWGPPPPLGDELCLALTGQAESQLVRDILNGKYSHLFEKEEAV